jgi:hypothetical protein
LPGSDEQELGAEAGGPNPMLAPGGGAPPGAPPGGMPGGMPMGGTPMGGPPGGPGMGGGVAMGAEQKPEQPEQKQKGNKGILPVPTPDDIKKYDLEIQTYDAEMDREERGY